MKIILVNIASILRGEEALNRPPSGILYVGGALKNAGYDVRVRHISYKEIDKEAESIAELDPLFVGFTVFIGSNVKHSAMMARRIKQLNPSIPIVWGGVHGSLIPEQCLKENYIDIVVIGEGEEAVVELATTLSERRNLSQVYGIGYKLDGKIMINPRRPPIQDIDQYEMDYSLVDAKRYIYFSEDKSSVLRYVTSRGCPFNCGFCYNKRFNQGIWRPHSPEKILTNIKALKEKYHFERVSFDDDYFFANKKRAFEILKGLKDMGLSAENFDLHVVDIKKEEIIKELSDLGVRAVFFGWESGSDRILNMINKGITVNDIVRSVEILAKYPQIKLEAQGIIGFPTETIEEVQNTMKLALKLIDIHPVIHLHISLYLPFPGNDLYELALREGFAIPENTEGWGDINYWGRPSWLKWVDSSHLPRIQNMAAYSALLNRTNLRYAPNKIKRGIKSLFYQITKIRIRSTCYSFPMDLYLYQWANKILRKLFRRFYTVKYDIKGTR